jgi:hypothetical protein
MALPSTRQKATEYRLSYNTQRCISKAKAKLKLKFDQLDLDRLDEPYRLSLVRRFGGRVCPDDPRHGSARGGGGLKHTVNTS